MTIDSFDVDAPSLQLALSLSLSLSLLLMTMHSTRRSQEETRPTFGAKLWSEVCFQNGDVRTVVERHQTFPARTPYRREREFCRFGKYMRESAVSQSTCTTAQRQCCHHQRSPIIGSKKIDGSNRWRITDSFTCRDDLHFPPRVFVHNSTSDEATCMNSPRIRLGSLVLTVDCTLDRPLLTTRKMSVDCRDGAMRYNGSVLVTQVLAAD